MRNNYNYQKINFKFVNSLKRTSSMNKKYKN